MTNILKAIYLIDEYELIGGQISRKLLDCKNIFTFV